MKPILFNTEMVKAIMDGRKTVTRRVVKPQPKGPLVLSPPGGCWPGYFEEVGTPRVVRPPYRPGEILYVRETFFEHNGSYYYKADGKSEDLDRLIGGSFFKWRPSIHMPKEAARIFLRVKDVRVERLQDITSAGVSAEGITGRFGVNRGSFVIPWNRTIKATELCTYGWAANPWVWVIEFERITKEEANVTRKTV